MRLIPIVVLLSLYLLRAQDRDTTKHTVSTVAFSIDERDLLPEGITYDQRTKRFFLSSIFKDKIVVIDSIGKYSDFIASHQAGFMHGVGLKVDAERRRLWANCTAIIENRRFSAVYLYDLDKSKLITVFPAPLDGQHLFNDLALTRTGAVYITDTENNSVFTVPADLSGLTLLVRSDSLLEGANGIAIFHDDSKLFVASDSKGLVIIDLKTKMVVPMMNHTATNSRGIDGLVLYQNSLIGIINGDPDFRKHRIVKFLLDSTGFKVTEANTIDEGNPLFFVPTTGVIVDDRLHCIANSCLHLLAQGSIRDLNQLRRPVILRYRLTD